jgi:hypothetical protein
MLEGSLYRMISSDSISAFIMNNHFYFGLKDTAPLNIQVKHISIIKEITVTPIENSMGSFTIFYISCHNISFPSFLPYSFPALVTEWPIKADD